MNSITVPDSACVLAFQKVPVLTLFGYDFRFFWPFVVLTYPDGHRVIEEQPFLEIEPVAARQVIVVTDSTGEHRMSVLGAVSTTTLQVEDA